MKAKGSIYSDPLTERFEVRMSASDKALIKAIGKGNASAGVRRLVEIYRENNNG